MERCENSRSLLTLLGYFHTIPDSVSCRHKNLSGIVWIPIYPICDSLLWKSARRSYASLQKSRQKSPFIFQNMYRSLLRYGFRVRRKAVWYSATIALILIFSWSKEAPCRSLILYGGIFTFRGRRFGDLLPHPPAPLCPILSPHRCCHKRFWLMLLSRCCSIRT